MTLHLENVFGTLALITSLIGLLPQIYKAYISKSTRDLSMLMLCNYFACSIFWIIYGTISASDFVVYSNILGLATSAVSIFQKIYYDATPQAL